MKNITTQFFVTFGVIFLILMVIGLYFLLTDAPGKQEASTLQQNNDALVTSADTNSDTATTTDGPSTDETSGGFELSNAQVEALISLGISPDAVPSSITIEQENCFIGVLGEARVEEIKAGAVPNTLELVRAKTCI